MPTSMIVTNDREVVDLLKGIKEVIADSGHCSVAYSSQGMKCTDYALRGLPQNALMHIWLREAAEFQFKRDCSDIELESMKRYTKMRCYSDTKQPFLVQTLINPETNVKRTDVTSSTKWQVGEMSFFLDWMQAFFVEKGLMLEAKGEYLELADSQNE
jgi:hypothetical protein